MAESQNFCIMVRAGSVFTPAVLPTWNREAKKIKHIHLRNSSNGDLNKEMVIFFLRPSSNNIHDQFQCNQTKLNQSFKIIHSIKAQV